MPPPPGPPLYTTKALLRATTALTERAGPLQAPGRAAARSPLPGPPLPPRLAPAEARRRACVRTPPGPASELVTLPAWPQNADGLRGGRGIFRKAGPAELTQGRGVREEGESVRTVAGEAVCSATARCFGLDSIAAAGGVNRSLHFVPGPLLLPDPGPRRSALPPSSFAGLCASRKKPFAA